MSIRPPKGQQVQDISSWCPLTEHSFNILFDDAFVTGSGIDYTHWKALPSPIGLKDRGDYRRDGLDVLTANGMLYVCSGVFTGAETDNTTDRKRTDGGVVDPTVSRLILPRFYNTTVSTAGTVNTNPVDNGKRIHLDIGDRLYVTDPAANTKVPWSQRMTYEVGENIPMFPIIELEVPIIDSRNIQYTQGVDFCITANGNICWMPGGKNPGIDPQTGKGRVYSIRYLYRAFYYVVSLPKEVRMTNITTNGVRVPERLASYAVIQREYVWHSQNRGDPKNVSASKTPQRAVQEPLDNIKPGPGAVSVDMVNMEDGLPPIRPPREGDLLLENGGGIELDNTCGDIKLEE
jgi:hypothetical protein